MPQTVPQILRCLTLGSYTPSVEAGELRVRGPQALLGSLAASIRTTHDELITFLDEWAAGSWPPMSGSGLREAQQILDCGLATALMPSRWH
jgi:hypothetical protein